jgi:hypothetical protein
MRDFLFESTVPLNFVAENIVCRSTIMSVEGGRKEHAHRLVLKLHSIDVLMLALRRSLSCCRGWYGATCPGKVRRRPNYSMEKVYLLQPVIAVFVVFCVAL